MKTLQQLINSLTIDQKLQLLGQIGGDYFAIAMIGEDHPAYKKAEMATCETDIEINGKTYYIGWNINQYNLIEA